MSYAEFLAQKAVKVPDVGLTEIPALHEALFPFQRDAVAWALRRGRAALFEECGLGKTVQQLEWARHVPGDVLILTPLAVAAQTAAEAARFGIDARVSRDGTRAAQITIANYEQLPKFDPSAFAGVVLDESSILKNFMGSTKRAILDAFAATPFKLACTATPAPNDHLELGNHAEFLGVMSSHEMIARWFINDTSTFGTYRLKGHAVTDFWDWVASWARCISRPSDLGYADEGFDLPPLHVHQHQVQVDVVEGRADGMLFRLPELSATSVHGEKRRTVESRAAHVAALVAAEPAESWLIWCDTNYEADALAGSMPDAVDVRGSATAEEKEAALLAFARGETRVLVTKPRIAGFGMNWQQCARVAFVGPTFSYEQYYQAVRRCWRFGQRRPVHVHVVMADTEAQVFAIMQAKAGDHEGMKVNMYAAMRRATTVRNDRPSYEPTVAAPFPVFLSRRTA